MSRLHFVVLGLSVTSSWGNAHAATYRGLLRELGALGHSVLFLERDAPWYAANRDMPRPGFCRAELYQSLDELRARFTEDVAEADVVIVGSFVPDGVAVGEWVTRTARGVTAFYDLDTPVTLTRLGQGDYEYISPDLVPRYQIYLSRTGGPVLDRIERELGSPAARPLYSAFDPVLYYGDPAAPREWDLGYLGTYCEDRQRTVERLLNDTARRWGGGRFLVAGSHYPDDVRWPHNVQRIDHLPPSIRRRSYCAQRFTLNVTRAAMIEAGHTPSRRLFEAAACGTPIISDYWDGIGSFFRIDSELLIARSGRDVLEYLVDMTERERRAIAARARARVVEQHTAAARARELVEYIRAAGSVISAA